jgi:hypothetical protein
VCATVTDCGGNYHGCTSAALQVDCTSNLCVCPDPSYPVFCPAGGGQPASCWGKGTVCSTVTTCSNLGHACTSAALEYDCGSMTCQCPSPSYPQWCPALNGAPDACYAQGVVCSTVMSCNGSPQACPSASQHVDCMAGTCQGGGTTSSSSGGSCRGDGEGCSSGSECCDGNCNAGVCGVCNGGSCDCQTDCPPPCSVCIGGMCDGSGSGSCG